jgi:Putative bacterial sensory transduction regulator
MASNTSETRDRVASMLASMVGRVELDAGGELSFAYESTRIYVNVRPFGEDASVVNVYAITNVDLTPSPELYEFVATHSGDWVFGHLAMEQTDDKAAVLFRETLLADFLDQAELQTAVAAVATTADQVDDQIKEKFGGRLATETVAGVTSS